MPDVTIHTTMLGQAIHEIIPPRIPALHSGRPLPLDSLACDLRRLAVLLLSSLAEWCLKYYYFNGLDRLAKDSMLGESAILFLNNN